MITIENFQPRLYQESILQTSLQNNTLIILPTGLGKTKTAILVAVNRLNNFQNSKVLFLTPTKPLAAQIQKEFIGSTNIKGEKISLLTGALKPESRTGIFSASMVIVATPQTIQKDFEAGRIDLSEISLLCIDEAHRSKQRFANTILAKAYMKNARNPRIIALTASPGGTKEGIKEVCENLSISRVEIRTESHEEVKPYLHKRETEWLSLEFPESFKSLHASIKKAYQDRLAKLRVLGFTKPSYLINKKDLLGLQSRFKQELFKNPQAFYGLSLTAQLIKLDYASELLETQGLGALKNFWEKLKTDKSKAAASILKDKSAIKAISQTDALLKEGLEHPKLKKLPEIVEQEISKGKGSKIIIFANYRNTVEEIINVLKAAGKSNPVRLIGQKQGITQKEQIDVIKKFEEGVYNVMVCTSIGEEGLNLKGCDLAIFFDNAPSSIRKIQRSGRVARFKPGKMVFMMTKGTRDVGFYWKAKREEKSMEGLLSMMQDRKDVGDG